MYAHYSNNPLDPVRAEGLFAYIQKIKQLNYFFPSKPYKCP